MDFKDIYPLVLMLVLIGVVIGIGLYVLVTVSDVVKNDITVVTEQITSDNESFVALTYTPIRSITSATNATSAVDLNYTANTVGIKLTDSLYNGETVNVSYDGKANSSASGSVVETVTAIGTIPTWLTIVVVVAMAAIVLALIMGAFGGTKKR